MKGEKPADGAIRIPTCPLQRDRCASLPKLKPLMLSLTATYAPSSDVGESCKPEQASLKRGRDPEVAFLLQKLRRWEDPIMPACIYRCNALQFRVGMRGGVGLVGLGWEIMLDQACE